MNTTITAGTKVIFAATGGEFTIAKVTATRVSWYVGETYRTGSGKNVQRMAWASMKQFLAGIERGGYIIVE